MSEGLVITPLYRCSKIITRRLGAMQGPHDSSVLDTLPARVKMMLADVANPPTKQILRPAASAARFTPYNLGLRAGSLGRAVMVRYTALLAARYEARSNSRRQQQTVLHADNGPRCHFRFVRSATVRCCLP